MLLRKVRRAMWAHKKSYLACIFLISIGMMMFTAMGVAGDGLEQAAINFYAEYRLADIVANVGAIPASEVDRLRSIEGIRDVGHRNKMEVRAELEGYDGSINLRLISLGEVFGGTGAESETGRLNDIHITAGLTPHYPGEIAINTAFFDSHGLEFGDTITVFVQGRRFVYSFSSTFLSPEYVYIAPSFVDVLPDNTGFGIAYITEEAFTNITGRPGISNNLMFTLQPGYEFDDVRIALQDALQPYGLSALIPKESQVSYSFVDMQTVSIQSVATSMPFVFIALSVVVLYLMMKRLIEQERTQIGTLKAFGYSNGELILHYMCYGAITGVIGGIVGWGYGYLMSGVYLEMFLEFFQFPETALIEQAVSPMYFLLSLGIATAGGLLGAFMGAIKILGLNPSEAMRPESPKPVKNNIIGKIVVLKYILTSRGYMALRGIARNPVRSSFVVLGVTFSFAILAFFGSMSDLVDTMIYSQFTDIRLYNARVTLNRPIHYDRAIESAFAVPHITQVEGLLELPATLRNRHLQEGAVLTGVPANAELFRVFDTNSGTVYAPTTEGLIITNGLAVTLNARAGDILYINSHLIDNDIAVPVTRVIEQNIGSGAFMELAALSAIFDQPAIATAIIFNTDNLASVNEYFRESRYAATFEDKDSTLQKYLDMMEPYTAMFMIMNIMGVAVAFAIIYNTATISLSERKREYATLRVLGMTVDEVCEIMRFEYWLLSILGMLLGIPMASMISTAVNSMLDITMFSMPSTLPMEAYVTGVIGCAVAIILSNWSAKRKISKFDMVEVLKERE